MNNTPVKELVYPEPVLKQRLRHEIDVGIALAADPANANLPELAIRVTTGHSPWYTQTCKVCEHKFREGDEVRLCPECGEPYHDDDQYDLHCWTGHFTDAGGCKGSRCDYAWSGFLPEERAVNKADDEGVRPHISPAELLVTQFVTGVETMWRPFGEQKVEKVQPGSSIVGRKCPWCRFTVRAGDWVVACPCGCGAYFHQDVFRHLTCWNEWNGVEGNDYCPITGRSYEQEADDRE